MLATIGHWKAKRKHHGMARIVDGMAERPGVGRGVGGFVLCQKTLAAHEPWFDA